MRGEMELDDIRLGRLRADLGEPALSAGRLIFVGGTEMKFRLVRTGYDRKTTRQKARHILKGAAAT